MEIKDIKDVEVRQGIIQRSLKIGDVFISSAGGHGAEVVFRGIHTPHELKEKIRGYRKS